MMNNLELLPCGVDDIIAKFVHEPEYNFAVEIKDLFLKRRNAKFEKITIECKITLSPDYWSCIKLDFHRNTFKLEDHHLQLLDLDNIKKVKTDITAEKNGKHHIKRKTYSMLDDKKSYWTPFVMVHIENDRYRLKTYCGSFGVTKNLCLDLCDLLEKYV